MQITPSVIQALNVSFQNLYKTGWGDTTEWASKLSTTVPSSTRSNTYGWMANLPSLRKWLGPKLIHNLSAHKYTLENEPYELTVGVDKFDIEDDNLGVYNPVVTEMGRSARKWPDEVLTSLLRRGTTENGFDGVPMFSTLHALNGAGNQSNLFTATPLNAANFAAVRTAMSGYLAEDGRPLSIAPSLLVVPPTLEDTANQLVKANYNAAGATNVQMGQASVLVVPELANEPTAWYLVDMSRGIKPLIWQLRTAPKLITKTAPDDDNVFWQKQFIWSLEARGAAGFGPWFLMARAVA